MFLKGTCFNPERGLNTGNVDQQKKGVIAVIALDGCFNMAGGLGKTDCAD